MTRRHDPRRLPKELIVLGLLILLVAAGLTAWSCSREGTKRLATIAFEALACPSRGSSVPVFYLLFSKLFWLWVLGAGTLVAGVGLAVRRRR